MFRNRIYTSVLILLFFLSIGLLGSSVARGKVCEAYDLSSLIRLHVIANSDAPVDQVTKLRVRDRIIKVTEPLLLRVEDPKRARRIIKKNLPLLERTVRRELIRRGRPMRVKVQLGQFLFPQRAYPFGLLPAGKYQGLRVTLGKGRGHNWWCVLYPPLCLLSPDAPTFKKSRATQSRKIIYRFIALEKLIKHKGLSMNSFWHSWGRKFNLF